MYNRSVKHYWRHTTNFNAISLIPIINKYFNWFHELQGKHLNLYCAPMRQAIEPQGRTPVIYYEHITFPKTTPKPLPRLFFANVAPFRFNVPSSSHNCELDVHLNISARWTHLSTCNSHVRLDGSPDLCCTPPWLCCT